MEKKRKKLGIHDKKFRKKNYLLGKLLVAFNFARDSPLPFHQTGSELHEERFDGVSRCPAARRQKFHANRPALHHEALFDVGLHDTHEGRRKRKIVRENDVQQDVIDFKFAHILGERGIRVNVVETSVPFEQIVAN